MGMILDDARAAALLESGAAGVAKRLALCGEVLKVRKALKEPKDTEAMQDRAQAYGEMRLNAIRAELLPHWTKGASATSSFLAHSIGEDVVRSILGEQSKDASDGDKARFALQAKGIYELLRSVRINEVDLGLDNTIKPWRNLASDIEALLPAEDASAADHVRPYTAARHVMQEATQRGSFGQSDFDQAANCELSQFPSIREVDLDLHERKVKLAQDLSPLYEKSLNLRNQLADKAELLPDDDPELVALRNEYFKVRAEHTKGVEEYHQLDAQFKAKRDALQAANRAAIEAGLKRMSEITQEMIDASPVNEKQAKLWAQEQIITKQAMELLVKMKYPLDQFKRDMAEFYRFVGGRLERLRVAVRQEKGRAAAVIKHGEPGWILLSNDGKNFDKRVLWHEMGHHIEADPAALAAAKLYIRSRSDGTIKPLKELTGNEDYGDEEEAYVGGFFSQYVGKVYNSFGATEVFSMALESFSHPALLARRMMQDPQTLEFVRGYIKRPMDTMEALHLQLRQSMREVEDRAREATANRTQSKLAQLGAVVELLPDGGDWPYNTRFAGFMRSYKAQFVGRYEAGAAYQGRSVLVYRCKLQKEKLPGGQKPRGKEDGLLFVLMQGPDNFIKATALRSALMDDAKAYIATWVKLGLAETPPTWSQITAASKGAL